MALEKDELTEKIETDERGNLDNAESEVARETRETPEREDKKPKDVRASVRQAVKEVRDRQESPRDKPRETTDSTALKSAPEKGDASAGKGIPKTDDGKPPAAAQQAPPATAAPASLSKEIKAQWDKLDPAVRSEFVRREADVAKGIEHLKASYRGYDEALAPLRDEIRSVGKTEAEAIRMLADWRQALRGPDKVQAFAALAKLEGIDLSQLAPRQPGPAQQSQPTDPAAFLRPYIGPISQEVTALKTELQRRDAERVQADIASFAKDKPHFDQVRVRMGVLMQSGQIPGDNPREVFDRAYEEACRSHPEIYGLIQQEAEAKRQADAQAAQLAAAQKAKEAEEARKRRETEEVAKARKAGYGPRSGSPAGMATAKNPGGQSVRESIASAVKELGAAI